MPDRVGEENPFQWHSSGLCQPWEYLRTGSAKSTTLNLNTAGAQDMKRLKCHIAENHTFLIKQSRHDAQQCENSGAQPQNKSMGRNTHTDLLYRFHVINDIFGIALPGERVYQFAVMQRYVFAFVILQFLIYVGIFG